MGGYGHSNCNYLRIFLKLRIIYHEFKEFSRTIQDNHEFKGGGYVVNIRFCLCILIAFTVPIFGGICTKTIRQPSLVVYEQIVVSYLVLMDYLLTWPSLER